MVMTKVVFFQKSARKAPTFFYYIYVKKNIVHLIGDYKK